MKKLPSFLNHLSEQKRVNSGYEAIQDFFISWTIRCAEDGYSTADPTVHRYAKKILSKLIFEKSLFFKDHKVDDDFIEKLTIKRAITQRQFEKIDIVAEIEYELEGKINQVLLSIENKMYTKTSRNQLDKYSKTIENRKGKVFTNIEKILIYIDYSLVDNEQLKIAKEYSYKVFEIGDLFDKDNTPPSQNELFDSYWFSDYGKKEKKEFTSNKHQP
jgi:hypothetical protein